MKKYPILLLTFLIAIVTCLGACRPSTLYVGCVSHQTATCISKRYQRFDGTDQYQIKFKSGDVIVVDSTTESGTLKLTITQKGENEPIYTGNLSQFPHFTVNVNEQGTYILLLTADNHEGSFSLLWE